MPGNTGLEYLPGGRTSPQVAFYDVADAAAMLAALDQAKGSSTNPATPRRRGRRGPDQRSGAGW